MNNIGSSAIRWWNLQQFRMPCRRLTEHLLQDEKIAAPLIELAALEKEIDELNDEIKNEAVSVPAVAETGGGDRSMIIALVLLFGLIRRQFSECLHRAPASRPFHRHPAIPLPPVQGTDQILRQYSRHQFLLLRGKCRSCGEPISWRYPLVELLNGLFYVWVYHEFGLNGEAVLMMALLLVPDRHHLYRFRSSDHP